MPAIGVVASSQQEARRYLDAMVKRGVEECLLLPRALTYVPGTVASVDGLLFTGGPDIDPQLYGQPRDSQAGLEMSPERDLWEIALLKAAAERDMPVFGICRGMQLLNVAFGGTLIQDLPGHRLGKKDSANKGLEYHQVYISPGSKLAAILGSGGFVRVNSMHHQGVKEAQKAPDLMASVYSIEDGLIEALESPKHDWVIGVQWHNELEEELPRSFGNLFQSLIERAEMHAEKMAGLPVGDPAHF